MPVTIKGRKGDTVVEKDEYPKPDTTVQGLGKLRPAFKPVSVLFWGWSINFRQALVLRILFIQE